MTTKYAIYHGVNAIVRGDGSVSIFRALGNAHVVLYDTMDHPSVDECERAKSLAEIGKLAIEERLERRRVIDQIASTVETGGDLGGVDLGTYTQANEAVTKAIDDLIGSLPD